MTDQHRIDYTGFGGGKVPTPNFDRIAQSVAFTNCQSVNPICTPMRAALITGKYTHQIGMLEMSGDLSLEHPTFMQALQGAGYHTGAVGKLHFLQTWPWSTPRNSGVDLVAAKEEVKRYGFDYIWQTSGKQQIKRNRCDYASYLEKKGLLAQYQDFLETTGPNTRRPGDNPEHIGGINPLPNEDYIDQVTADQIIRAILERPKNKPFYIYGSFCGPHKPFDPPKKYFDIVKYEENDDFLPGEPLTDTDKKLLYRQRRAYKAMIIFLDDMVGRILDTLEKEGIFRDTVVIFTSDHGEMLGDHGLIQKSVWWRESVTVPTAIRHPDYLFGAVCPHVAETNDLAATVLDIAGLDPEQSLGQSWPAFHNIVPCRSLMPIVRSEAEAVREVSFSECGGNWHMLQSDTHKYIRTLRYDVPGGYREILFDLTHDPCEQRDIAAACDSREKLMYFRQWRDYILDSTPPAQTRWARKYLMDQRKI